MQKQSKRNTSGTDMDVEEGVLKVMESFARLVNMYNTVYNNDRGPSPKYMKHIDSIKLNGHVTAPLYIKEYNYYFSEDRPGHETMFTHIDVIEMEEHVTGKIVYGIKLYNGEKEVLVANIPPYNMVDSTFILFNEELIERIANATKNNNFKALLEDTLILRSKVLKSPLSNEHIPIKNPHEIESTGPLLTFLNVGRVIKTLMIFVAPDEETYVHTIIPSLKTSVGEILYRVPDYDWKIYVESFVKLLILLNARNDIYRLEEKTTRIEKIFRRGDLLIKASKKSY